MSQVQTLTDQVALVTGGSRGIGRAISLMLASHGAKVAVNYASSAAKAEEVVAEIRSNGGEAMAFGFDVGNAEAVEKGVKDVLEQFGKVDILVNNAGIAQDGLLVRTSVADWQKTIDINLSGSFYCTKAVAKSMMKSRYGRVINVSSVIGEMGNAGQAAYAASKSGLFGLTKTLAKELGSRNITVNSIAPGYIATDMTAEMSEDQTQGILQSVALGRLGQPEDIANAIAFLASPHASYITGQVLGVNGGMYM